MSVRVRAARFLSSRTPHNNPITMCNLAGVGLMWLSSRARFKRIIVDPSRVLAYPYYHGTHWPPNALMCSIHGLVETSIIQPDQYICLTIRQHHRESPYGACTVIPTSCKSASVVNVPQRATKCSTTSTTCTEINCGIKQHDEYSMPVTSALHLQLCAQRSTTAYQLYVGTYM